MSEYKWKPFTLLVSAEEVKGNDMKISVGDTVLKKDGSNFSHGKKTATVEKIDHIGVWFEETRTQLCSDKLVKYSPSPIRTVTRREIVAGNYGLIQIFDNGCMYIETDSYTSEQCREAAHLLNQIAEVLEENGK